MSTTPPRGRSSLPHPRATALFARTIYRELRRASYTHEDLVRFVTDLMEVVTVNLRASQERGEALSGVIDPETGIPNRETFEEILDFEIRRLADEGGAPLLLACVEIDLPSHSATEIVQAVHERASRALARRLRANDVIARSPPNRYFALLPHASEDLILALCARFGAELHEACAGLLPAGARLSIRWIAYDKREGDDGVDGHALLERCLLAPAIPLGVIEEDRPTASVSLPPPAPKVGAATSSSDELRRPVVLALGGGPVRVGVHVGVLDVLDSAGIDVAGIAGTGVGALVGAMVAMGLTREEITSRFVSFASTSTYREIRQLYAGYMRRSSRRGSGLALDSLGLRPHYADSYFRRSDLAFMSDAEIAAAPDELFADFITHFIGAADRDIASLDLPFVACAADLAEGRLVLFMRGPLHQALRASCAVPGLFAPQRDGERLCIDGSMVIEVPFAAAAALGIDAPVLGVHLERPTPRVSSVRTSAEVMTRAAAMVHAELVREQLRHAPLVVHVPVATTGWLDFRRALDARALGERATKEQLPALLQAMDRAKRRRPSIA